MTKLRIPEDILRCVERSALLFPLIGRHACALDLERQQVALQPIKIGCERTNSLYGKHDATEAEYRTCIVPVVRTTDERADMTKLIQIRDIKRSGGARNTKARAFARASELELPRLRKRPIESVDLGRLKNKG
jgi:hypothetical protein